jgi:hypothetical protein
MPELPFDFAQDKKLRPPKMQQILARSLAAASQIETVPVIPRFADILSFRTAY